MTRFSLCGACRRLISIIESCVLETIKNMLDLLDIESISDCEVLDTRGVPTKGSLTVKLVNGKDNKIQKNLESWNSVTVTAK